MRCASEEMVTTRTEVRAIAAVAVRRPRTVFVRMKGPT